jgi:hypothetical protein
LRGRVQSPAAEITFFGEGHDGAAENDSATPIVGIVGTLTVMS